MVSIYHIITLLAACSSASAVLNGASYTCHSDVEGKELFVGDQGLSAQDYSSGKGCVNEGPDGLGSVLVSPNWLGTLASWMVETEYCILAYKRINCVGLMDIKKDWKIGGDDDPLIPLEGMSSVKVVKVSGGRPRQSGGNVRVCGC